MASSTVLELCVARANNPNPTPSPTPPHSPTDPMMPSTVVSDDISLALAKGSVALPPCAALAAKDAATNVSAPTAPAVVTPASPTGSVEEGPEPSSDVQLSPPVAAAAAPAVSSGATSSVAAESSVEVPPNTTKCPTPSEDVATKVGSSVLDAIIPTISNTTESVVSALLASTAPVATKATATTATFSPAPVSGVADVVPQTFPSTLTPSAVPAPVPPTPVPETSNLTAGATTVPTPSSTSTSSTSLPLNSEATTFFDDVINAPPAPSNIVVGLSPSTSMPDLYHDFFDNHPELYASDQSSDPEMDLEDESPILRARSMARELHPLVPLIAERPKVENVVDTINLRMLQQSTVVRQSQLALNAMSNGVRLNGQNGNTDGVNGNSADGNSNGNNNGNNKNGNGNGNVNGNNDSDQSKDQNQQPAQPPRRKKASRACFHCQKAHLTCDDSRPCQRCIKRDLADTCADGLRKKAKYLQDTYDSPLPANNPTATTTTQDQQNTTGILDSTQQQFLDAANQQANLNGAMVDPTLFPFPMTGAEYGTFGSETVNLEYSIISNMLSSPTGELNQLSDLSMVENWPRGSAFDSLTNGHPNAAAVAAAAAAANQQLRSVNGGLGNVGGQHTNGNNTLRTGNGNTNGLSNGNSLLNHGMGGGNTSSALHPTSAITRPSKRKFPSNTPENVYANTKQPFNYTEGFHYLLQYVREKMDKEEMMRICRAMAMFRPSFIALIMNLTPEDLIFMEKCFQRTILEFEKLISFSGTPTVVWRRTGEIALVGKEFSLLTQWGRDQLVGKKTYIYELMDHQSAVEYWEKFSTHAFENTEQTVMTTCILLSPTNRVVPCTFCFTIKRDIFDIPLAIVGNFLPILS
ncbi:Transcriptional regulator of nonfermentable carbon utilization [Actinomortierella wolfii]|nr:Transcriptional regulator of nonfermentable carbon utilization [Actinomortierella wolfii]